MWLSRVLNWSGTVPVSFLTSTPTATRIARYHAFRPESCSGPLSSAAQTMRCLEDGPPQFVDLPARGAPQISLCHSMWPDDLHCVLSGVYGKKDSGTDGRRAVLCDPPRAGRHICVRNARYGRNARSAASDHRCTGPYATLIEVEAR